MSARVKTGVTVNVSGSGDALKKGLEFLKSHKVLVGIPESEGMRKMSEDTNTVDNVQLAFIHTYGSPLNRIPPRPFLEPAITEPDTMNKITENMKEAALRAVKGDTGGALSEMHKAGTRGENAAQTYIGSDKLTPNAPITIEGGWMRNRKSGKPFKVEGKGSSRPLIDTGSLRGAITHVVEGE